MPLRVVLLLLSLLLLHVAKAQLCQGSLGEPIVNITFGAGPNPGAPLNAAATGYQYIGTGCPQDGFYTVRNSTVGCNVGWHVLNADHTGNPNGYFMLVNASNQPSAFYIDTVDLTCNNTTYEFAAWVANMNRPSECGGSPTQPNLTFSIEALNGTVLQSYNTGNISVQSAIAWRQFGFFFTTQSNISRVVLRIFNNSPGGCGNDLALDDITFRPCGAPVTVSIDGAGTTKNVCLGDAVQATLTGSVPPDFVNPVFQWQQSANGGATWADVPGATAASLPQNFTPTAVGSFLYRLTVNKPENAASVACRVRSEVLTISVSAKPTTTLNQDGPYCEGETVNLVAGLGTGYVWSGPNGFSSSISTATPTTSVINFTNAPPAVAGRYYVRVSNVEGCTATDSTDVVIYPKPAVTVSPDSDDICEGDAIQLAATGVGSYSWSPARGLSSTAISNPIASPTDSTVYSLVLTDANGCTDTASTTINVHKQPVANAGPDRSIVKGQAVQLQGVVGGTNVSYVWSPPEAINNVTLLQPTVSPTDDKAYTLTVVSNEGCGTAVDSVLVEVFAGIFVPTAFTPNADGKNDRWIIPGLNAYTNYEVLVFNRWGQMVYRSKDANSGWDGSFGGKLLPTGVYPYLIKLNAAPHQLKGWVMIIR